MADPPVTASDPSTAATGPSTTGTGLPAAATGLPAAATGLPAVEHSTAVSSPVALGEPPARAAAVRDPVVLGRPQRRRADLADLGRQREQAVVLLALAAAERVHVEFVLREPAHEPVAPGTRVTAHVRIATLREESYAHDHTPDLPLGEPPLGRRLAAGKNVCGQAGGATDGCPSHHQKG
ncbi:hypothetical protein GCM10020295_27540 [Streptomyces cinereospinus]